MAVRKKEKGKQETGIVIHSWKQSNQQKPLVKIQSAQVVKIQSAPTQLGLNKREAKDFIDAFFELVAAELAQGKSVKISGFGNFEVHTKSARPGRNPITGEPVVIAARRVVTFRASGSLRQQVNKEG